MAKRRFPGKGALVQIESAANTYNSIGLALSITPPAEERAIIDMTAMEDTAAVAELGIEEMSTLEFEVISDPGDTGEALMDTWYGTGNTTNFRIVASVAGTTWTKQFQGKVAGVRPSQFTGKDAIKRSFTVVRTGAVADTFT